MACPTDGDGNVNGRDFLAWQAGFGITHDATPGDGDADDDGGVDFDDLLAWQSEFGSHASGASGQARNTPEPAAWILVAMLLAGLVRPWPAPAR